MEKRVIPNKWINYQPVSKRLEGTRFVAFKVPIKENLCRHLPQYQKFLPTTVLDRKPKIALVINLTNTNKFYNKNEFLSRGIDYARIPCPPKQVPSDTLVQIFFDVIDTFFNLPKSEYALIGVHCAHGVNRTGFMICKYMIMKMGLDPKEAMQAFKLARGHAIEREPYIEELLKTKPCKIEMFSFIRVPIEAIYKQGIKKSSKNDINNECKLKHKSTNVSRMLSNPIGEGHPGTSPRNIT